jgi:hypothetical protein
MLLEPLMSVCVALLVCVAPIPSPGGAAVLSTISSSRAISHVDHLAGCAGDAGEVWGGGERGSGCVRLVRA